MSAYTIGEMGGGVGKGHVHHRVRGGRFGRENAGRTRRHPARGILRSTISI